MSENISYDTIADVTESVSSSGLVFGLNSMVLLQAAVAGKKVVSYQPGLQGKDPLVTNDYNLSKRVTNRDDLRAPLAGYVANTPQWQLGEVTAAGKKFLNDIKNKQATGNVLRLVDSIVYDKK